VTTLLDSGSSGSVISKQFLEKVGRKVDQPSMEKNEKLRVKSKIYQLLFNNNYCLSM
jgi:hypothetical protein